MLSSDRKAIDNFKIGCNRRPLEPDWRSGLLPAIRPPISFLNFILLALYYLAATGDYSKTASSGRDEVSTGLPDHHSNGDDNRAVTLFRRQRSLQLMARIHRSQCRLLRLRPMTSSASSQVLQNRLCVRHIETWLKYGDPERFCTRCLRLQDRAVQTTKRADEAFDILLSKSNERASAGLKQYATRVRHKHNLPCRIYSAA